MRSCVYACSGVLATLASIASAQAESVTLSDLEGHTVQSTIVTQQTVKSVVGITTQPVTYSVSIKVGANGKLKVSGVTRTVLPNGEARSRTSAYDVDLGKPYEGAQGHQVWILENSQLIRIATMKEGGNKLGYELTKDASGIKCKLNWIQAPQVGVGRLASSGNATASGHSIEILKQTETSKSCRVTR